MTTPSSNRRVPIATLASAAFVAAIVFANYATTEWGVWPVGFGLTATAGTYFAGLTFVMRDTIQDAGGRFAVVLLIAAGAALSWWLSVPELAVASGAAFAVSELADFLVYSPLRARGYLRAAVASNVVGAVVDTAVFLWLAHDFLARVVPGFDMSDQAAGQLVGKLWVTVALLGLMLGWRTVRGYHADRRGASVDA